MEIKRKLKDIIVERKEKGERRKEKGENCLGGKEGGKEVERSGSTIGRFKDRVLEEGSRLREF